MPEPSSALISKAPNGCQTPPAHYGKAPQQLQMSSSAQRGRPEAAAKVFQRTKRKIAKEYMRTDPDCMSDSQTQFNAVAQGAESVPHLTALAASLSRPSHMRWTAGIRAARTTPLLMHVWGLRPGAVLERSEGKPRNGCQSLPAHGSPPAAARVLQRTEGKPPRGCQSPPAQGREAPSGCQSPPAHTVGTIAHRAIPSWAESLRSAAQPPNTPP